MTVYVDDMKWPFGRMLMSHMVADTHEELVEMADRIGVSRRWIQKKGTPSEHFDICQSKRDLAIANGAKTVTMREMGRIWRRKRA